MTSSTSCSPHARTRPRRAGRAARVALLVFAGCGRIGAQEGSLAPPPSRLAILPVDNLTAQPAPLDEIQARVLEAVRGLGIPVVEPEELEAVLARIRLRYSGGITDDEGNALRELARADAVLVTSLEAYDTGDPPVMALGVRLVSIAGATAKPLWADDATLAGDDAPGAFELGSIHDVSVLLDRAVEEVAAGLAEFLAAGAPGGPIRLPRAKGRFAPSSLFVPPDAPAWGTSVRRVAVVPFMNASTRPRAGEIVATHVVRELLRMGGVEVIEPGRVRKVLLDTRLIQDGGISLAQTDVLAGILEVDLVITGRVQEFRERIPGGPPVVEFNAYGVDVPRRKVAWLARTYAQGRHGVYFFDAGEVRSVGRLARETVRAVVRDVVRRSGRP